jgi:hypothetical protein
VLRFSPSGSILPGVFVHIPVATAAPPGAPLPVVEWLPLVIAALLGALAAQIFTRWRQRPPVAVVRLGSSAGFRPFPGLPGVGEGHSIWFVDPADRTTLLLQLATRLAARGPVLLLPHPDRRSPLWAEIGRGSAAIFATVTPRPTARQALEAAAQLAMEGRQPAIVVDGIAGLELAPADRPDAALRELLDAAAVPTFVVLAEGEAPPGGRRRTTTRVNRTEEGFEGGA